MTVAHFIIQSEVKHKQIARGLHTLSPALSVSNMHFVCGLIGPLDCLRLCDRLGWILWFLFLRCSTEKRLVTYFEDHKYVFIRIGLVWVITHTSATSIYNTRILLHLIDIDECAQPVCQFRCNNTLGSFLCTCPQGYLLTTNKRDCAGKLQDQL